MEFKAKILKFKLILTSSSLPPTEMNIVLNVWIEKKEEGSGTSCDMESESYRKNHMFKKKTQKS